MSSGSVGLPKAALVLGSVTPPQGDIVDLRVHLGCTKEISSFELTLQNWSGKYSPSGPTPILVGSDGSISLGRGANVPILMTCRVENIEYESPSAEEHYLKVTGRCWGERLFRSVINKSYINQKGEAIVKDLMDSFAGLSHTRNGQELVKDTSTTYTKLDYEDTPLWDVLKYIAETADLNGIIGYDFRVAPDGKFEFFPQNSRWWVDAGLVLYLPFDEGSGAMANDESNNGDNGALINGPTWVDGKYGKAVAFNGVSQYVRVPDAENLRLAQFTVELWIKSNIEPGTDMVREVIGRRVGQENYCFNWSHYDPDWMCAWGFQGTDGGWYLCKYSTGVHAEVWYHLAATYNGSVLKAYLDGLLDNSSVINKTPRTDSGDLFVSHPDRAVNGIVDEVRIYNRPLTPEEIWDHYLSGPPSLRGRAEVSGYRKDISCVRNKVHIYGAADKLNPDNMDAWTDWTQLPIPWTCGQDDTLDVDTVNKVQGISSVYVHSETSLTLSVSCWAACAFDSALACGRTHGYQRLNFAVRFYVQNVMGSYHFTDFCVRLKTDANNYFEKHHVIPSEKQTDTAWNYYQESLGPTAEEQKGSEDVWVEVGSPDWRNITQVQFQLDGTVDNSSAYISINIDKLFFDQGRFSAIEEDSASEAAYGLREMSETDEELVSDAECDLRAKSLLAYYKDPAEYLTVKTTVLDYGLAPVLAGDRIHATFPNENIDGDYRAETVEYYVDGNEQTLEVTFELGKVPPLLADYLYGLRTKSITIEKLARTKAGMR